MFRLRLRFTATVLMCGVLVALSNQPANAAPDYEKVRFCKRLAEIHKPDDDVNYKPGIDVHGKPVVPADIGSSVIAPATIYPVRIPLRLDVIERYGIDAPEGMMGEAFIAEITVHQDGRTLYNGQDISANMQAYCLDEDQPSTAPKDAYSPPVMPQQKQQAPIPYDGEALDGQYH